MRSITTTSTALAALSAAVLLIVSPVSVQAATPAATAPVSTATATAADYTVFVDAPTGFVFVKLPQGWKFAGTADGALPARLPSHVTTRLLPADPADAGRVAVQTASRSKL